MPRTTRTLAMTLISAALSAGLGGCFYTRGGPWYSGDAPLTYVSTPMSPKTVSVVDTRTGETVWSMDVPAGKKLVVKFDEGEREGQTLSAVMRWRLFDDPGAIRGKMTNETPAPPVSARRVDMTLRSPSVAESTGG
ncbi:MAG: hypothetical protein D6693_10715 [Planctomycetota bacterium]|nr:MAG: hypothetical protein D6693_10715 [Planctomycetota bacterium]